MPRFASPFLRVAHSIATIIALLGVSLHLRIDHADVDVSSDSVVIAETPIVDTQQGRGATALRPSPALISSLTIDEGFRGNPYKDSLGHLTIGIGTKLPLTETEAQWLLGERLTRLLASAFAVAPRRFSVARARAGRGGQRLLRQRPGRAGRLSSLLGGARSAGLARRRPRATRQQMGARGSA